MPLVHCEGGVNNTVNNTQALPAVNEDEDANSLAPPQVQPTLPPISGPAVSYVEGEERCGLLPESKQPEALPSHQQALPSVQVDQTGQTLSARHSSRERLDVNALNLSALRDSVGSSGSGRDSFGPKGPDSARLLEEGDSDVFYEADDGLEQKQTLQATTDHGRFVIAPDSKFGMCWKVLITLLSMLVILVAPVNFSQSWATGSVIVVVCQFVFLIDVYLHLFHVVDGETVSFAHFRRAYLRSWFVVDVVSAIPFGVSEEVVHVGNALVLLRLLHLPSYLGTIRGYILDHGFVLPAKPIRRLIHTLMIVLMLAHIFGSIYGVIIERTKSGTLDFAFYRMENLNGPERVLRQVYWGLQTLFTVGYGELSPRTYGETRFNIIVLFAGSLCYAYIIANSSSLIDNLDVTTLSYKHKMDRIRKLLKAVHLDQGSTLQIESYFQKLWLKQKGRLTTAITNDMPKFLRVDLYFNAYPWVIDLPFFKKIPDGVMREIMAHMKILFFQKMEQVLRHNTIMEDFLIVTRGQLAVHINDTVVEDLHPGSYIGENVFCPGEALFPGDIRSEKDTEILSLSSELLCLLVERMCQPQDFDVMVEKLQERYAARKEAWRQQQQQGQLQKGSSGEFETRQDVVVAHGGGGLGRSMKSFNSQALADAELEKDEEVQPYPWWKFWIILCTASSAILFPLRIVFFPREGLTVLVTICFETMLDVFGLVDSVHNRRMARQAWKVSPGGGEGGGSSPPETKRSGRRLTAANLLTGSGSDLDSALRGSAERKAKQRAKWAAMARDAYDLTLLLCSATSFVLAVVGYASNRADCLVVSSWLRTPHLLRVLQIFPQIEAIKLYFEHKGVVVNPGLMLLTHLVLIMFFFIHYIACGWQAVLNEGFAFKSLRCDVPFELYTFACEDMSCIPLLERCPLLPSGLCEVGHVNPEDQVFELVGCPHTPAGEKELAALDYLRAYYFTLVTITTCGYGDIVPMSDLGTAYVAFFMMLLGATLYTFFLSTITSISQNGEITESDYGHNMEALTLYLRNMNIPPDVQHKCFVTCDFAQTSSKCNEEVRVLNEDLPAHLKTLVEEFQLLRIIRSSSIFKDSPRAFVKKLVPCLVQDFYPPKEDMWHKTDIDAKMFFLVHGEAELLALDGKHIKKQSAGDTVGEIQLFYPDKFVNMLRSMTFCEVYLLHKCEFDALLLDDFPLLQKSMQDLVSAMLAADSTVSIMKNLKNTKLSKMMHEESSADTAVSYKYRVFEPDSKVQLYWDVLTAWVVVYLLISIPFQLAFYHGILVTQLPGMLSIDICCDVVLLLDIHLRTFHFGIDGEDGMPVLKQAEFGETYKKGNFKLHLAASVPFNYLVYCVSANYKYVALAKVNRFMRIGHVFGVLEKLDAVVSVRNESIVKVAKLVFALIYCSHFVGCIFYLISYNKERGWVAAELVDVWHKDSIDDVGIGDRYMRSLYWGITTIAMVGHGDITPGLDSPWEVLFTILVLMFGGMNFALIVSNLEEVVAQADISTILYQRKLEEIKRYLKYRKLPPSVQASILTYYNFLWLHQKAVDTSDILSFLPRSMRLKVVLHQTYHILEKVAFIKEWKCFREAAGLLRPHTFLTNESVFEPEQVSDFLFLLVQGKLRYSSRDLTTHYITFQDGDCVGDFQFFAKKLHPCVCKALETSHTFKLASSDFEALMERNAAFSADYRNRYSECVQKLSKATSLASISKNLTKKKVTMFMQVDEMEVEVETFVFVPESNVHRGWCAWVLVCTFYAVFSVLYRISFLDREFGNTDSFEAWLPVDILLDLSLFVDVLLNLRFFAVVHEGVLVKKPSEFALIYLKTWFVVDVVAVLPFDYVMAGSVDFGGGGGVVDDGGSERRVQALAWARANRFLRVLHLTQLFASFEKALEERTIHVVTGIKQVVQLLLCVLIAVHVSACVRFSTLHAEGLLESRTPRDENNPNAQYTRSFFYALYTLTTVGYGSQTVDSKPQTGITILFMVVGSFLCDAGVTATLSNLVLNEDLKEGTIRRRSDCLEAFFKRQNTCETVRTRITQYYRYTITSKRDLDEARILQWFPEHLRTEVLTHMVLEKSQSCVNHPLFRVLSTGMVQSLMNSLRPLVGPPDSILIDKDNKPIDVYIIITGQVCVLDDSNEVCCTLSSGVVGNFFGKNRVVRCETFCDLFALDAIAYNQVAAFGSDVGNTVESVLGDHGALKHFEEFAKLQHVSENIAFLLAVTDFTTSCSDDEADRVHAHAQSLYKRFICETSDTQINIAAHVKRDIMAELQNPEMDTFNAAYEEILTLIRRDVFPRFKKSAQYRALLHEQDTARIKKMLERKRNENGKKAKRRGSHSITENTMIADTFAITRKPPPMLRNTSQNSSFAKSSRRLTGAQGLAVGSPLAAGSSSST